MKKALAVAALLFLALLLPVVASAQSNIEPSQAFVWSETLGWIHSLPTHGGVFVLDTHLEGFAWSENIGWISSSATQGQVVAGPTPEQHDGFAWAGNFGFIHFPQ